MRENEVSRGSPAIHSRCSALIVVCMLLYTHMAADNGVICEGTQSSS